MTTTTASATIRATYGFPPGARLLLLLLHAHVLFRHTGAGGVVAREESTVNTQGL
ncbi:MAG TPA: hypothetical protein VJL31_01635 [Gemmatimonadales bacterium]|nr:hypothetical protein [Gemmatimonadales bacterium]